MIADEVGDDVLKQAILVAFAGDVKLLDLYDPSASVETVDDVVEDVFRKIQEYKTDMTVGEYRQWGVYEGHELIGYVVGNGIILVSFGLNILHRPKNETFFRLIQQCIGAGFVCFLWQQNVRARKWLTKMGMHESVFNDQVNLLQCQ